MKPNVIAKRISSLEESATLALNARVKQLAAAGQTVYNLTAGELDAPTPKYIQTAVAGTLQLNKYTPVAGLPELRAAVAEHAASFYDASWIEPANAVITAGAKPALAATFLALLDPGDEVIMPTPAWVSYRHLIELAGGVVVEVPLTSTWDLDVPAISRAISPRTKLMLVNSPHNPTGAVFSPTALTGLAQLLQSTNVIVIADDIYTKLVFAPDFQPITAYTFHPERLVIINGFSKSQALTGWRIGYVIAPVAVAEAITKLLSHLTGNAAVPSQHAALAALAQGDRPVLQDELRTRREIVAAGLRTIPQLGFNLPGGAFYFFLDITAVTTDSASWCEQLLLEKQVALVPGEAFAAPGFARLSFAANEATLTRAITLIRDFASESRHA